MYSAILAVCPSQVPYRIKTLVISLNLLESP
jgi:hypothetical protein